MPGFYVLHGSTIRTRGVLNSTDFESNSIAMPLVFEANGCGFTQVAPNAVDQPGRSG